MRKYTRTYLELSQLKTFYERLKYLMLEGEVGDITFGGSRYLNQALYKSQDWLEFRDEIIIRDLGCDLGVKGYYINPIRYPDDRCDYKLLAKGGIIHHINPITKEDILNRAPCVFDRNNVILVSPKTHNIIHYAHELDERDFNFASRRPNDTKLW